MIRNGTIDDLDIISEIEAASFPKEEADPKDEFRRRLMRGDDYFRLLEIDGETAAFIHGMPTDRRDLCDEMFHSMSLLKPDGKWLMILSVATLPKFRRKGCAGALMKQMLVDARRQNRMGVVLTCKEHLIDFYSGFGFECEGVSESTLGGAKWYKMRLVFR